MNDSIQDDPILNYIYWEQDKFIKTIKTALPNCKTEFIFNVQLDVYNRCLARVWDSKGQCNPNLRCKMNSLPNTIFCKHHLSKGSCGRIDEMPDEFSVMRFYRKNDPDVDSKIDLNHELECAKIKKIIKNNILYNITDNQMSIAELLNHIEPFLKDYKNINKENVLEIKHKLLDKFTISPSMNDNILLEKNIIEKAIQCGKYAIETPKKKRIIIKKNVKQAQKENLENSPVGETTAIPIVPIAKNPILANSKLFKKNITSGKEQTKPAPIVNPIADTEEDQFDYRSLDSVLITDQLSNQCELFIDTRGSEQILFNLQGKQCGTVTNWVDIEDIVPEEFKTTDNIVLNPYNNLPIQEYIITTIGSIYCGLDANTYREYIYDEDMDSFRKNSNINR